MASDDVELQLTAQLEEQREALHQVEEAIAALNDNADDSEELLEMQEALVSAIKELEAALLQVKKERLLAALDAQHPTVVSQPSQAGIRAASPQQIEAARTSNRYQENNQSCVIQPGQPCRFRAENGCWYAGRLDRLDDGWAHVSFDMPTRPHMLEGCRVPADSLRSARQVPATPQVYQVGDVVYVKPACMKTIYSQLTSAHLQDGLSQGLWLEADVVEVDDMSGTITVSFPNGPRMSIDIDDVTPCAEAGNSDLDSGTGSDDGTDDASAGTDNNDTASSGENESEIDEEERSGLGSGLDVFGHARLAVAAGIHTGTRHFADWEAHTRGIASKLMAKMGYKTGTGLGNTNAGIAAPVEVLLLPGKAGLGASEGVKPEGHEAHHTRKKRKGGGERNRRKKLAAARRAAAEGKQQELHEKQLQGEEPGLFGFINNALGDSSEAAAKIRAVEASFLKQDKVGQHDGGRGSTGTGAAASASRQQASRHRLIDQQKVIDNCHAKVAHFQAMLQRNSSNTTLAPQIASRLKDAQAELQRATSEQARMSASLKQVENNKKMLKF